MAELSKTSSSAWRKQIRRHGMFAKPALSSQDSSAGAALINQFNKKLLEFSQNTALSADDVYIFAQKLSRYLQELSTSKKDERSSPKIYGSFMREIIFGAIRWDLILGQQQGFGKEAFDQRIFQESFDVSPIRLAAVMARKLENHYPGITAEIMQVNHRTNSLERVMDMPQSTQSPESASRSVR